MTEFNTIGKRTQITVDSVPTDGSSNPVSSNGVYDALAGKQDTLTIDSVPTENSTNPVQSGGVFTALGSKMDTGAFHTVGGTYSDQNPVTTQEYVNTSVATNTANYISNNGEPFTSVAQLEAYSGTVTNNDYAFVTGTDSAGNTFYDRYKATVSGSSVSWAKEYRLNNSSFTADQWAAINSGVSDQNTASTGNSYAIIHDRAKDSPAASGFKLTGGTTAKTLTVGDSYTLGAACERAVVTSISSNSTSLPTEGAVKAITDDIYSKLRGTKWVFGMSFNKATFATDPTGCLAYTDDCTGYTPVSGPGSTLGAVGANSSWKFNSDGTSTNPLLNACFYATFTSDGVLHEKLNPNNLTQKIATWNNITRAWVSASGASSITTEDTMFCIPAMFIYSGPDFIKVASAEYDAGIIGDMRSHTIGGKVYQYLAIGVYPAHLADGKLYSLSGAESTVNTTRPVFRTAAQAKTVQGGRAMVWNWFQYNLLRILTIFAAKSFNGQARIGMGGKSYGTAAGGQTNAMGPFAGSTSTSVTATNAMKAFIEDFWGHNWEFIDDFAVDNTTMNRHIFYAGCNVSPTDTPAANGDIPTDKISLGVMTNTGTTAGWRYGSAISSVASSWGLPLSEGGSTSAYLCDGIYIGTVATPTLGRVGGDLNCVAGGHAGPSALFVDHGFTSSWDYSGARLAFVFDL